MRKYLLAGLVGAACAALATTWLIAQPVVPSPSGNECWNAGQGPGGPSTGFVCAYQMRSSWGYVSNPAATAGTVQLPVNQNAVIFAVQPTGAGVTFNMPLTPTDGQIVAFCNTSNAALTTVAVAASVTAPQVFATGATTTFTTLAARTCVKLMYTASNTTWSQVQ